MLESQLPTGTEYVNVGHSNLTDQVFEAISCVPNSSATVVLHDLLPLTHPQFNTVGAAAKAERVAQLVSRHADRVVHISDHIRSTNDDLLSRRGRLPPGRYERIGYSYIVGQGPACRGDRSALLF